MNPFQTLSLGFSLKKISKFCKFGLDILIKKKKRVYTKASGFGKVINVSPYMILHSRLPINKFGK